MTDEFKTYAKQVVANAARLGEKLIEYGFKIVSGGTDNHLLLLDLRNKGMLGKKLAKALDRAHIVTNYNTIPNDPAKPFNPSGIRFGTPAVTTSGMKERQMDIIAEAMNRITDNIDDDAVIEQVGNQIVELSKKFPIPESFI